MSDEPITAYVFGDPDARYCKDCYWSCAYGDVKTIKDGCSFWRDNVKRLPIRASVARSRETLCGASGKRWKPENPVKAHSLQTQ